MVLKKSYISPQNIKKVLMIYIIHSLKLKNFKNSKNINFSKNYNSNQINISFIGKPNSGKSSLINTIIGNDRLVTGSKAGLTIDSIQIPFSYKDKKFFID